MTDLKKAPTTVDDASQPHSKLLLVDDNESLLITLRLVLERNGFQVSTASNVNEALKLIGSQEFDVLLSDLHMPDPGDGLTVVSAMRHANPKAVTLIFSGYPAMKEAAAAILGQADGILVKPLGVEQLVATIRGWIDRGRATPSPMKTLADIIEAEAQATIAAWLVRVDADSDVITIHMDHAERSRHLPQLFRDLVFRLRFPLPLGTRALVSVAAAMHGLERRSQGYTAAMLVEESRMLQVSIFETLQRNISSMDFSLLLGGVMSIADEVDSQLAQAMASFTAESKVDNLPIVP
jgi:DNA-binding response OmpR family regulator